MNRIIDFFRENVEKNPDKTALIFEDQKITYKELGGLVDSLSSSLTNLKQGSVVSIFLENSIDFVVSYLGILNAGMIAHLIPNNLTEQKIEKQLKNAQSKFIISSEVLIKKLENIQYQCEKITFAELNIQKDSSLQQNNSYNDIAYLIFTSGTTAEPKGVSITQSNTVFTTNNIINILKYNKSDIHILPLPLSHSFGLGCLHASLFVGSTLIILKNATNIMDILAKIKKYNASTYYALSIGILADRIKY